jgi:membrane protein implicated in regulation of membrane protease activity
VTTDQAVPVAIAFVVLLLIAVGVVRVAGRRRGKNEDAFGAGGTSTVPLGAHGVAKTALAPSGVVLVVGEQWTARSRGDAEIASERASASSARTADAHRGCESTSSGEG